MLYKTCRSTGQIKDPVVELTEGLTTRKSIRKFLNKDVSKGILKEILFDSHRAPSSSNQQPWNFLVVTGVPLETLCTKLLLAHTENRKPYDPSKGGTIPANYIDRTRTLFKALRPFLSALGEENRSFIETGSLRLYGAPVGIVMTIHKSFPKSRFMDIGMAAQNLMLSAHARGLGSCAIGLALLYEGIIRRELDISPEFEVALVIALGYPDTGSPVNEFRSPREPLDGFITWIGFEE